jgi:hypothetical protein
MMMDGMSKEEFTRKWKDTHTNLKLGDYVSGRGSVIKREPSDRGITKGGDIPGKRMIEAKAIKTREDKLKDLVLDASLVRAEETLTMDYDKLLALAVKMMPQKVEQSGNVKFTFGDIVRRAHMDVETVDTIEDGEIVE